MNVAGTGIRVVVATRPVDIRKGHDGLAVVVEHELRQDALPTTIGSDDSMQVDPLNNCISSTSNRNSWGYFSAVVEPHPRSSGTITRVVSPRVPVGCVDEIRHAVMMPGCERVFICPMKANVVASCPLCILSSHHIR